jgi:hypothetical protein
MFTTQFAQTLCRLFRREIALRLGQLLVANHDYFT